MVTAQPIDQAKQEAFVNKVLGDTSATMTTILASIGDRLGLFKDLAASGPATSAEVASRMGTNERYVREWLGGMTAAGYVEYDPATTRFTLPAEHAAAVATEGGPFFFGGIHQMLPALVAVVDQVTEAFHNGGGVRRLSRKNAVERVWCLGADIVMESLHSFGECPACDPLEIRRHGC